MTPISWRLPLLDEVVIREAQRGCLEIALLLLRVEALILVWNSLNRVARIAGAIEKLSRIALAVRILRLCQVLLIIVFRFSLLLLVGELQLVFGRSLLLSLSDIG